MPRIHRPKKQNKIIAFLPFLHIIEFQKQEVEMRYSMLLTILFFCSLVVAQSYNAADYFPIGLGYSWQYIDSTGDETDIRTVVVENDTIIDGFPTWIAVATSSDSVDTSMYQTRSDGIYMFIPPASDFFLYLPQEFSIGDTWDIATIDTTMDTLGMSIDVHIDIKGSAISTADISVPAGDFLNCIDVVMIDFYTASTPFGDFDSTINQVEQWLAQDIGVVKAIRKDPNPMTGNPDTYSYLREYDVSNIKESIKTPEKMKVLVLPNPFNSSCRISVPDGSKVEIFDIRGNLVASHSGGNQFLWHPNNSAPAGIYSVRCTAKNGKISTTKILYVK